MKKHVKLEQVSWFCIFYAISHLLYNKLTFICKMTKPMHDNSAPSDMREHQFMVGSRGAIGGPEPRPLGKSLVTIGFLRNIGICTDPGPPHLEKQLDCWEVCTLITKKKSFCIQTPPHTFRNFRGPRMKFFSPWTPSGPWFGVWGGISSLFLHTHHAQILESFSEGVQI